MGSKKKPECEQITISASGKSIKITTDSDDEFEVEVVVSIGNACASVSRCVWDGMQWVCSKKEEI
jgi:hypothetical protein